MVCADAFHWQHGHSFGPQIDALETVDWYAALAGLVVGVFLPIAQAAQDGLNLIGIGFLNGIPRPTEALTPDFDMADLHPTHSPHRSCRVVGIADILLSTVNVCGIPGLRKESVQIGRYKAFAVVGFHRAPLRICSSLSN